MIGKTTAPSPAESQPTRYLPIDEARVEEFAGRLIETYTAGMVGLMIDVDVQVHDVPEDPMNSIYVAHKPT